MIKTTILSSLILFGLACSEGSEDETRPVIEQELETETTDSDSLVENEEIPFAFLALGDSYTIGESVAEDKRWPVQLANEITKVNSNLVVETKIIARTGWTTQDLGNALVKEELDASFDLVSLLIGVNNQYRGYPIEEYPDEFEKLLNRAIGYAGGNKNNVIVVSIPDYGFTPFGQSNQAKISHEIDAYNEINKRIAEENGIKYYFITDISRDGLEKPELVADDGLHPSGEQYRLWVERIIADNEFLSIINN
ncbi:SGNH/GDSL hydrolase family protein [Fulvivirga lutea]|uniref:SGNH/GDSL hydrolase family protein n=1 Tax=Fulvivirga lutea TaxID=2810512 RepID=A0A975A2H2_9BACT|nr:SGNH/GDSL hydrolase family protein [Fulvivirga lutea]QSE98532.1 SGNH/GDSL hydrolase family protein [Fulvivirga lutea]